MGSTGIWVIGTIPDEAARHLASQINESDAIEDIEDAATYLMAEHGTPFVAAARKADPAAALYNALGAAAASALPGTMGNFLLSADEVADALPKAEAALDLSAARRSEIIADTASWMTTMGDEPDFDAAALLEAPLRVLRDAAEARSGAAAFTRWY
ncbi:hypothetical protein [Actinomadura rupiterrae]|uniref:hypothetical protein n=1 Tax=Actinomadura rupiterrae TaxID=559627 RepID=UPI0020A432F2|nr:hypothetical protein [Actinomadura rupiterrae]MCP2341965.1 hypothetical protein [Actinomadura rupiterrae]